MSTANMRILRQEFLHSLIFHRRSKFYVPREDLFFFGARLMSGMSAASPMIDINIRVTRWSKVTAVPTQRYIPLRTQNV
jgi:hypothetical protein